MTWNHRNYYKLVGIDLSSQTSTTIPQEINLNEVSDSKLVTPNLNIVNEHQMQIIA